MSRIAKSKQARSRDQAEGLVARVLHLRIKDKHAAFLRKHANEVNLCWNFINEASIKILQRERRFPSAEDLHRLTRGVTKEGLSLHSQTVQAVNEEYVLRRRQFKKTRLRWRISNPKRSDRSLGWIPFKASAIRYKNGQILYGGKHLSLWDSYGLSKYKLGTGNFSEDARGRWYLNLTVKVKKKERPDPTILKSAIGIDLGLKDFIVDSEGAELEAPRLYRDLEPKLAVAQRARKKTRTRAIHAKIANRRKDFLHKLSTKQARSYAAIFVGDVSSSKLAKTGMAKSVLDAGWSTFRTMLQYKCDDAGAWFRVVNEARSTIECSACGARTGPTGLSGLSVRQWTCAGCGTAHHRDRNSAINIRERGLALLENEFSATGEVRACEAVMNKAVAVAAAAAGHGRLVEGIPVL